MCSRTSSPTAISIPSRHASDVAQGRSSSSVRIEAPTMAPSAAEPTLAI